MSTSYQVSCSCFYPIPNNQPLHVKEGDKWCTWAIVCSVDGGRCSVRSCFISFGVAGAGVISVASIPTLVDIFRSCTCWASSVDIVTNLGDYLTVMLQKFIDLSLLLVY